MIIREVKEQELPLCVGHGKAFYDSRNLGGTFDPIRFRNFWQEIYFLDRGIIIGAWKDDVLLGGFGGVLAEGVYDGVLHAQEHFWWMPKGGLTAVKLIHVFEEWAKAHEAMSVNIGHFADTPRIGELYRNLGYTALEDFYRKVL